MLRHLTNWVKSAEHSIEDKEDEGEDSADEEFVYISEIDDDLSEEEDLSEYEPEPSTILNVDDVGYGQYVLYQWQDKAYYVGTVTDINTDIEVSLMKRCAVRNN